ncbi:hypothetical protein ATANTOWER_006409, partial [Ataeniobius toweri]|nr:hypothetical protein [Ataeniobius toweri]
VVPHLCLFVILSFLCSSFLLASSSLFIVSLFSFFPSWCHTFLYPCVFFSFPSSLCPSFFFLSFLSSFYFFIGQPFPAFFPSFSPSFLPSFLRSSSVSLLLPILSCIIP